MTGYGIGILSNGKIFCKMTPIWYFIFFIFWDKIHKSIFRLFFTNFMRISLCFENSTPKVCFFSYFFTSKNDNPAKKSVDKFLNIFSWFGLFYFMKNNLWFEKFLSNSIIFGNFKCYHAINLKKSFPGIPILLLQCCIVRDFKNIILHILNVKNAFYVNTFETFLKQKISFAIISTYA